MTTQIPDQADTAPDLARQWRAEADATWNRDTMPGRASDDDIRRERAKVLRDCADEFEAVTAAIRDQAAAEHRAERDLMHSDLGDLLEATGLGNYARPETPHDVMQQAITEVRSLTARLVERVAHLERLLADDRRQWKTALADHYLMSIECDAERKLDNPVCGCSKVFLGWHPTIGEARQAWIRHVDQIVASSTVMTTLEVGDRVAELEQLAADILSHFTASGDGHRARVGQVQIAKWQTTLKGQS